MNNTKGNLKIYTEVPDRVEEKKDYHNKAIEEEKGKSNSEGGT